MTRRALDPVYDFLGALGAVFIALTLGIELFSIFGRLLHIGIDGYDAYAGYFLAAGSFLALAHTLRRGDHIRVTLLLGRLQGRARWGAELACLLSATVLSGYFAWFAVALAYGSWHYNDVSQNIDATPLWIPQLSMAIGVSALFVAFVDELWAVFKRGEVQHSAHELARTE